MSTEIVTTQAQRIEHAQLLAKADLLPAHLRNKPANLLWTMEMAEGLDLTLAQAVNGVVVINGTPSLKAETMRALVLRAGHRFRVDQQTDTECVVSVARKEYPDDVQQFTYTVADAKRAGLTGGNWTKHPKAMLLARATSTACRAVFPDVIQGFYAPEEVADFAKPAQAPPPVPTVTREPAPTPEPKPTPPANVDTATGEIVDAEVVDDTADMIDKLTVEIGQADLDGLRRLWSTWHKNPVWPDVEPLIADRRAQLEAAEPEVLL